MAVGAIIGAATTAVTAGKTAYDTINGVFGGGKDAEIAEGCSGPNAGQSAECVNRFTAKWTQVWQERRVSDQAYTWLTGMLSKEGNRPQSLQAYWDASKAIVNGVGLDIVASTGYFRGLETPGREYIDLGHVPPAPGATTNQVKTAGFSGGNTGTIILAVLAFFFFSK